MYFSVGGALFCDSLKHIITPNVDWQKEAWVQLILMAILDVERQPGMEKLAQSYNRGRGGRGGCRGGAQMWRVCRRATQISTPPTLLFQWSIKSKTHTLIQGTHTHTLTHTKPRHCLKSQSKLAPKGIPTTLFTKGIVYVF